LVVSGVEMPVRDSEAPSEPEDVAPLELDVLTEIVERVSLPDVAKSEARDVDVLLAEVSVDKEKLVRDLVLRELTVVWFELERVLDIGGASVGPPLGVEIVVDELLEVRLVDEVDAVAVAVGAMNVRTVVWSAADCCAGCDVVVVDPSVEGTELRPVDAVALVGLWAVLL
jgi:hypothetical protein